jgi:hypothetical protein
MDSTGLMAHELPRLPKLTCSRSDTRPERKRLAEAVFKMAADHVRFVVAAGRPGRDLAEGLTQLDVDESRLTCLWRSEPPDIWRASLNSAWNALTGLSPATVGHYVGLPGAAGDPS